ncbi:Ell-associated factor Eaf [Amphibalanus amphitrite]|uniref:Ell-associated factor Eaf n=1 Tax=Amphibalanus amphitrite TaxID=1232801 RepID=A0A6A4W3J1_AMPAM|nr:Ell-associated factor Eaf [Amphibalanus amphitrite]
MASIADRLGVSGDHELVIGASFSKGNKGTAFHSVRYDFKPASVDPSKTATVDVGDNHSVTVTVPHIEGTNHTVYRGNSRPYQKECVLIVDHETGDIRLERLTENIQVKKTRSEGPTPRMPAMPRPLTPIDPVARRTSPSQHQAAAASGPPAPPQRLSPHSVPSRSARASPTVRRPSPVPHQQPARREPPPPPPPPATAPGSMPSILGMLDDDTSLQLPQAAPPPQPPPPPPQQQPTAPAHAPPRNPSTDCIGTVSDSDSDSDSGSSSDSDMDVDSRPVPGRQNGNLNMPSLLTDLQLSESD